MPLFAISLLNVTVCVMPPTNRRQAAATEQYAASGLMDVSLG